MASFTDCHGRGWTVHLDLSALARLSDGGYCTDQLRDGSILPKLLADPLRMILFVYRLVFPQCQQRQISADEFWREVHGSYARVWAALVDALDEFDPALGLKAQQEMSKWH